MRQRVAEQDPLASGVDRPVQRPGERARARLGGTVGNRQAGRPVVYRDQVSIRVRQVSAHRSDGVGPGVVQTPYSLLTLTVTNGSRVPVRLDQVVVSVVYGSPPRAAAPNYDGPVQDLAGLLRPGRSASGVYGFSTPVGAVAGMTILVDLDGGHAVATFHGRGGR